MTNPTQTKKNGVWTFWLICLLLILGSNPHWLTDTARVVSPASECVLSPADAWNVPLVKWLFLDDIAAWPFGIYAIFAALMITLICQSLPNSLAPFSLLAAMGLSLLIQPPHLPTTLFLFSAAYIRSSPRLSKQPVSAVILINACGLLSVLCLLEFGLVLFFCCCALALTLYEQRTTQNRGRFHSILALTTLGIVGIVAACFFVQGFTNAMLRPVSWLWIRPSPDLLPSLSVSVLVKQYWLPVTLLGLFLIACWKNTLEWKDNAGRFFVPLLALSMVALGCLHYLVLASYSIVGLSSQTEATTPSLRRSGLLMTVCLIFAGGRLAWNTDRYEILTGERPPHLLQPSEWNTRGGVFLLNLGHSRDWQTGESANRFQLILDDRWDVFGDLYPTYAEVCRDIKEGRAHSYLRTDGQWGGSRAWITKWSPALLVASSDDIDAIRSLTLSTQWRLMGIDGKRTIFGHMEQPQNAGQIHQALQCLMTLEWPAQLSELSSEYSIDGTIVANSNQDARNVAGVLRAMRFPYAALRFLREDDSPEKRHQQAWCYLELAHRVHRHSGQVSLLDQYRAVSMLRKIERNSEWSSADRLRIARSLQGLGLHSLAAEFGAEPQPESIQQTPRTDKNEQNTTALGMNQHERKLRQALTSGDTVECNRLLEKIKGPLQEYYSALVHSSYRPAELICADLQQAINSPDGLPSYLKGEALFYLGCAAIEAGDTTLAISALDESHRAAPEFPLRAIRQMHLGQLSRR